MNGPDEWEPDSEEDPAFGRDQEDEPRDPGADRAGRPKKSPSAFRTISEVADDLHIPQHVLRFWETRFPQVKPLKRGGGRRYYRPDDIALLRRISDLLYIQGYTIKGVQRLLREGDGTLSGDLPPPEVADRGDEPETTFHAPPVEHIPTPPEADELDVPAVPVRSVEAEALEEVLRLRHVLGEVLGELQLLRQRLPV
jgi:DNA-binding transcriptional MerR regulator